MIAVLHTSSRTVGIRASKARLDRIVRSAAAVDGWAYITVASGPNVRSVVASTLAAMPIGATHLHLDTYAAIERGE
jgi:hypothetical protein